MTTWEEPGQASVVVDGAYLDPMRIALPLSHTYGRADAGVQSEAPSVTFDWLGPLSYPAAGGPQDLAVGLPLRLEIGGAGGGEWDDVWDDLWSPAPPAGWPAIPRTVRFTGRISDLRPSADEDTMVTQVTAVGTLAEIAQYEVGATPWPQQAESARVAAIDTEVPYTFVNGGGTPVVLALDVDHRGALEILQDMAGWTGAVVWEDGQGRLQYTSAAARSAASPAGAPVVPATSILAPVEWDQAVGNVVNDVTVLYGPLDPQAAFHTSHAASVARYGVRPVTIATSLANLADAQVLAGLVLVHWALPAWDAPQITVPMSGIDPALWAALVALDLGKVILTDGVTSSPNLPAGSQGRWLVEGWHEEWDRNDAGAMRHTLQFAVSDFDRWTDTGQLGTTTTAVAAPSTAPQGTPIAVTATVKDETTAAVPAGGRVEVWDGSTLLGSGTLAAGGTVTINVTPAVGARVLGVRYVGTAAYESSSVNVPVTVTAVTTATVVLTASDYDVHAGDDVVFTATVTPATAAGTIQFEYQRDGSAWTVWSGHDQPVVGGVARATWGTGTAGHDYVWRAHYLPAAGEALNSPYSASKAVTVRQKTTHTRTFSATWAATYQQDGDKRSDTSDCYQGYYSSTNGNQRSLAGFANPWPSGETVTKVRVKVTTPHWNSASGGTLVLGSDDATSEPGSWPSGVNDDRLRVSMERDETRWIDVTAWAKTWRALAFGPGPSTSSTYYGYVQGTGSDRPVVEVTSYEWV